MGKQMTGDLSFQYLNLDNGWPQLERDRLVIRSDGALTLAHVPRVEKALLALPTGRHLKGPALSDGPAGIGVDACGLLYITDPASHRIIRVDPETGQAKPLLCPREPEADINSCSGTMVAEPGQLHTPRGVLVGPRDALYVADSGNHRVQVIDLPTGQVRGIWGQPHPWTEPAPSAEPGRFHEPQNLVADQACHIYVLSKKRTPDGPWLQKFDLDGRLIPEFWETLQTQEQPGNPTHIAIFGDAQQERLFILDGAQRKVLVYRTNGDYDADATAAWETLSLQQPVGIAIDRHTVYIGDTEGKGDKAQTRILVFDREGRKLGEVRGHQGPVAGLHLDHQGRLLIHPGSSGLVKQTAVERVPVMDGHFFAGPFQLGDETPTWQRLYVQAEPLPPGAHVQLFTYCGETKTPPASPIKEERDTWQAAPTDTLDVLVHAESSPNLWIYGELYGDGGSTPIVHQIRLEAKDDSWLRYLPGIYQREAAAHDGFLDRTLHLFESMLTDEQHLMDTLPRLFDLDACPDDERPTSWLDWLAGWLAQDLDESWDTARRRRLLAQARGLVSQRGTARGLERLIKLYTGLTAHVIEPPLFADFAHNFYVQLFGEELDSSTIEATVEQLIPPLFRDTPQTFWVQLYAGELGCQTTREKVEQLIERERPAHTTCQVHWIEARMRVGLQAQVGVDTIIANPNPPLILDCPHQLGVDTMLAAERRIGGTIGREARIGESTTLV